MANESKSKSTPLPLPATLDDVPSSDLRRHALSSKELSDIRALIGVAKGTTCSDSRRNMPLTGRKVLVPVTSKAFFEGTLQPRTTHAFDCTREPDDAVIGHEYVIVNDGSGRLAEMTRGAAADVFEKQQAGVAVSGAKKNTASVPANNNAKSTTAAAPASASQHAATTSVEDSVLPLMEIRETCDVSGTVLDAEVVNISSTMQRLGEGLKNVAATVGSGHEAEKKLGGLLAQTLKEGERDILKDAHKTYEQEEEGEDARAAATAEPPRAKAEPISDGEYAALCSRMEELARLEEEEDRSRRESVASARRLQSGGWSKGFLNRTDKKSAVAPVAARRAARASTERDGTNIPVRTRTREKKGEGIGSARILPTPKQTGPSTVSLSRNTATSTPQITESLADDKSNNNDKGKQASKVSFSNNDNIKEIPRIGRLKVPPRPSTAPTRSRPAGFHNPASTNDVADPYSPVSAAPFEENIFRGAVKERKIASCEVVQQAVAYHHGTQSSGGTRGGEKKLSRFAQQRRQLE